MHLRDLVSVTTERRKQCSQQAWESYTVEDDMDTEIKKEHNHILSEEK